MTKYKLKNGEDFVVPGVGQSVDGVLETDVVLEGAQYDVADAAPAPAPAAPVAPTPPPAQTNTVTPTQNEENS